MNTVTIKIDGIEYNLKERENEEYLLEVVKYVDGKVKDIMANNRKLSSTATATLAVLNIADELLRADIEIEVLMKKNTSLDKRNLTLKERVKEIREEAGGIEFNISREINKLNGIMDELNKKLLEAEELKDKVTLLEDENEEGNILREKISKLEKEISAKEVDINEKDSLKLGMDSLKNENLTLREEVENCYKEVENLKETNELLRTNEVGYKEKFIKLNEECKITGDDFKKTKIEKNSLKQRNKEIKSQSQNSRYKVLNLERKLIDIQVKLAYEKKQKNALLKDV